MAKRKSTGRSNSKGNERVTPGAGEGFWDRPVLINLVADILLLAGGVLLIWAAGLALQRLPMFPLRELVVTVPLEKVSRAHLEQAARQSISGNFFTVNLEAAQQAFERLPWVRRVELRRRWPDSIELALEEHEAAAQWTPLNGEERLVNIQGEVFHASTDQPLPALSGPEGSAPRVLARYQEFSAGLAAAQIKPSAVALSAREAWQLRLDNNVVLELGRDQAKNTVAERLTRFTSHYPEVRSRIHGIAVVDMRYPNGFALRTNKSKS